MRSAVVSTLEQALRERVDGEVRFDAGSRAAYATDASNFRQVPVGVVVPRTPEAAAAAVAVCREHDTPVLSRSGGTSLARAGLARAGLARAGLARAGAMPGGRGRR